MSSIPITYETLHLLWPRGDGAVRMLMYLWRIVCQGNVPNFTDQQLALRFFRTPATIARWRTRWKDKGILLTTTRCRRTFYEVNTEVLQEAVQTAVADQEAQEAERKAKALARQVKISAKISENLRQQWQQQHQQSDHFDPSSQITIDVSTTSRSNQSSVTDEPVNGLAANDGLSSAEEAKRLRGPHIAGQDSPQHPLKTSKPAEKEAACDAQDLCGDTMRRWLMEAARRLVLQGGQQWNRNLEQLIRRTETPLLMRAVSSLWEQSQRGNVRAAPKFLTRAIQRKYSCSKGWTWPDDLPAIPAQSSGVPAHVAPAAPLFPDWLPTWAVSLLEGFTQQGYQLQRYELVDGGIQIWSDAGIRFFPQGV